MRYLRPAIIALLTLAALLVSLSNDGARAAYNAPDPIPGTVGSLDIDVDTTGNTPTSVSSVESSIGGITVGATHDIDIVVDEVPPYIPLTSDGITGFAADLFYDQIVVSVVGLNHEQLMAAGGGYVAFGTNDLLPDGDGDFRFDRGDLSQTIEDGEGVLVRITLKCEAQGTTLLSLGDVRGEGIPDILSFLSENYPINSHPLTVPPSQGNTAEVTCGGEAAATPPSTATPTPAPTPVVPPSPTPAAAPAPTATPAVQAATQAPAPTPTSAVLAVAALPEVGGQPPNGSSPAIPYAVLAGCTAIALAAGGWYAARRWLK